MIWFSTDYKRDAMLIFDQFNKLEARIVALENPMRQTEASSKKVDLYKLRGVADIISNHRELSMARLVQLTHDKYSHSELALILSALETLGYCSINASTGMPTTIIKSSL